MSILTKAAPLVQRSPLIITLCGSPGSGKTSLAATFPEPFIIRTQGEAVPRDVDNPPAGLAPVGNKPKDEGGTQVWCESELFDQLMALVKEDHPYKTLILDTVTGLENLFVQNILAVQPPKQRTMNSAAGGYGSAWGLVVGKHSRVMKAAEVLRDRKGMHVVFLAHTSVVTVDLPDAQPYSKYELKLHADKDVSKDCAGIYTSNVDVVGFIKQETIFDANGKAMTTDERRVVVGMSPANVSKNRLGIERELKFIKGENPFAPYI